MGVPGRPGRSWTEADAWLSPSLRSGLPSPGMLAMVTAARPARGASATHEAARKVCVARPQGGRPDHGPGRRAHGRWPRRWRRVGLWYPAPRGAVRRTHPLMYRCRFPSGPRLVQVEVRASVPAAAKPGKPIQPTGVSLTMALSPAAVASLAGLDSRTVRAATQLTVSASEGPSGTSVVWPGTTRRPAARPAHGPLTLTTAGTVPSVTASSGGRLSSPRPASRSPSPGARLLSRHPARRGRPRHPRRPRRPRRPRAPRQPARRHQAQPRPCSWWIALPRPARMPSWPRCWSPGSHPAGPHVMLLP